jgi:hypothetical protein
MDSERSHALESTVLSEITRIRTLPRCGYRALCLPRYIYYECAVPFDPVRCMRYAKTPKANDECVTPLSYLYSPLVCYRVWSVERLYIQGILVYLYARYLDDCHRFPLMRSPSTIPYPPLAPVQNGMMGCSKTYGRLSTGAVGYGM